MDHFQHYLHKPTAHAVAIVWGNDADRGLGLWVGGPDGPVPVVVDLRRNPGRAYVYAESRRGRVQITGWTLCGGEHHPSSPITTDGVPGAINLITTSLSVLVDVGVHARKDDPAYAAAWRTRVLTEYSRLGGRPDACLVFDMVSPAGDPLISITRG